MRLIAIVTIFLAVNLVSACNKEPKSPFGDTVVYPASWSKVVKLPENCKPFRTKIIDKLLGEKEGYVSFDKAKVGGVIHIGFEYHDGWAHWSHILITSSIIEVIGLKTCREKMRLISHIGKAIASKSFKFNGKIPVPITILFLIPGRDCCVTVKCQPGRLIPLPNHSWLIGASC